MGRDIDSHTEGSMGIASRRPRHRARQQLATVALAATAAVATALVPASAGARSADAHAARTISIKETANLKLDHKKGFVLEEHGLAKGTLSGEIYIQLRVSSQRNVTATIQFYPHGGLLRASAKASYRVVTSKEASFAGTLNITSGSGRYSKAKGSGLKFTGTVHRPSDSVSVSVSGRFSY
jgi:hypothetical protein